MAIQIGDEAKDFVGLKGVDGNAVGLSDFSSPILVMIFSCNHCPYVQAYEDRYKLIQSEYKDKGVQVVAINSNDAVKYPDDSFDNMVKRAEQLQYNFPYLYDESQEVARAYGATNTPHVFVFDAKRVLQYTGRIDDSWDDASRVSTHDLKNVLEALIKGESVAVNSTLPVGCSIKWK